MLRPREPPSTSYISLHKICPTATVKLAHPSVDHNHTQPLPKPDQVGSPPSLIYPWISCFSALWWNSFTTRTLAEVRATTLLMPTILLTPLPSFCNLWLIVPSHILTHTVYVYVPEVQVSQLWQLSKETELLLTLRCCDYH